jgi:hypothetical protein
MKSINLVVPMTLNGELLYSESYSPGFSQSDHPLHCIAFLQTSLMQTPFLTSL